MSTFAPGASVRARWRRLEHAFDAPFGAASNPVRHLGSLAVFFFCLLAASGTWLYAVLDWWLLFIHPLTEATSPVATWSLVIATLALLFVLPFMAPAWAALRGALRRLRHG